MKTEKRKPAEIADILSIISIAVAALLLILLFKVKGGILGIVLGTVAVAALIYWFTEIKKIFKEEKAYPKEEAEWFYDLTDEGESVTLIAKVPGPPEEVKVRLVNGKLEIEGGANFMRRVHVPKDAQLRHKSYINGVLHVKLQKTEMPNNKMPLK
jgi:HSP20 family molecular chaperone IbpA